MIFQGIVVLVAFERVPPTVQAEPSSIVVHADLIVPVQEFRTECRLCATLNEYPGARFC